MPPIVGGIVIRPEGDNEFTGEIEKVTVELT
jgi:hypothetical protein